MPLVFKHESQIITKARCLCYFHEQRAEFTHTEQQRWGKAHPTGCSAHNMGDTSPGIPGVSQQLHGLLSKCSVRIPWPPYNHFYLFNLSVKLKPRGRRSVFCSDSCTVRLNRKSSPKTFFLLMLMRDHTRLQRGSYYWGAV